MLISLGIFLTGPRLYNEDLISTKKYEFTLEPYGNKTVLIPSSFDQTFYLISARNLILNNTVFVEINATGPFTLYKLDGNITVKLAEHTSFYSFNLFDIGVKSKFLVENEAGQNISVKMNLKHILTVKVADFTIPHAGLTIFIITLPTLQILSLIVYRDSLIGIILKRIFYKFRQKYIETQEIVGVIGILLEISIMVFLILLLAYKLSDPLLQELRLEKSNINYYAYIVDYYARLAVLCIIVFGIILVVIWRGLVFIYRGFIIWIYKSKGRELLEIRKKESQIFKSQKKIIIILIFPLFILLSIMIYNVIEFIIILGVICCWGLIFHIIIYNKVIKQLQRDFSSDDLKKNLSNYIETGAKIIGIFVLVFITLLIIYNIIVMPIFTTLTYVLFFTDFYFSSVYEDIQYDVIPAIYGVLVALGQTLVGMCYFLIGVYWVNRTYLCKFVAKYKFKLLKDVAIFFIIVAISEYLIWSYYSFLQNRPYNIADIQVSIFIGMTARILEDLLNEIRINNE
jgi:hypothetical protein